MARNAVQDDTNAAGDGPVRKPQREPIEQPAPRPTPKPPIAAPPPPAPRPAAPRPTPRPIPRPPGGPLDGPIVKPVREPAEPPLPTKLSGPIGERWRALGGLAWGQPTTEPERVGSDGKMVAFALPGRQFAAIIWRPATGAVLVGPTMWAAYQRQKSTRGPLGLPTRDEATTHDGVGRYQSFDDGVIVWHQSTGAWSVFADINRTYGRMGGSAYGYPIADQALTPDGRAWVQEFRVPDSGGDRSIYWTSTHGAHPLYGAIRDAWRTYRGGATIGYPTTDEMAAEGGGRWQRFEGADYIWRSDTGAHEVHGAIATLYGSLGGSNWGYPTTDETATPNGSGRFNHFIGPDGAARSIYWTPSTGAQAIVGPIRQRWAELGWERSHLGYPRGAQTGWPEGGPGSLQQPFEHGRMLHHAGRNQTGPDPIDFFHDFGKSSQLEGWVRARLFSDGNIAYTGRQRATGENSYSFGIQVSVTDGTTGVANSWEGRAKGTFDSGSRNADWNEPAFSPAVASAFWDLQTARFDVQRFKDKSLGWVSGVFEAGLKFLIGSGAQIVLGPAGGALIVVGALAGTVIGGGNVQGGLRIVGGTLWMAGPAGTLVALVAEGVAQLATTERPPSDEEWRVATLVFTAEQLPARDSIRITNAIGGGNRPFVYKRFDGKTTINMGEWYEDPMGLIRNDKGELKWKRGAKFIHEMAHVWQVEHGSDLLLTAKGMAKVFGEEYAYTEGKPFSTYNLEQQAHIVQDWFARHYTPASGTDSYGLASAAATNERTEPLWLYIRNSIRAGKDSAL